MKKILTLVILIAISSGIFAQTQVDGNQSGTWTAANSPYQVIGDITVSAGEILTIEAGVEVNFQAYYGITILGTLNAMGTELDSIFFTTDNQSIGWNGISFGQSIDGAVTPADGISNFSYCRFEYGKTAATDYPYIHGGAIRMINSDVTFTSCVFSNNEANGADNGMGGAIYAINTSSSTSFTDCDFYENHCYGAGGAIEFTSALNVEILRCKFIDNSCNYGGGAILFYSTVDTKFTKCLFAGNYTNYDNGGAIKTEGSGNTLFFENCTMVNNEAVYGSGGAAALYYSETDFVNCIVYDNTSNYDDDNVYVDPGGSTATVNYCNMIMPDYSTTGSNNIDVNPLFVDATNGDYHLQETSTCIDAGTDIGLPYIGTAPDMGCFEYGWVDAPYAISYTPSQNQTNVQLDATVSVTFNEDVSVVDLSGIVITDATNATVTGITASLEADNRTITISHDGFVGNMTYTVTVPANCIESAEPLSNSEIVWSFTTKIDNSISIQNSEIQIFPNPTNGIFTINNIPGTKNIDIIDISGRIIEQIHVTSSQNTVLVDLSDFNNGIYFVKINSENKILTTKVIKK